MITDTRKKIFSYIQKHKKVRAHELVLTFSLSNVAIHKQLNKLLQEGKIEKTGTPPFVFYVESKHTVNLEEIKQKITPILKKARVTKAALFGSYVRGDYTKDSDIDILVGFPEDTTLLDVAHLKNTLEEELQKEVDVVSYNAISPLLRDSILSNHYAIL